MNELTLIKPGFALRHGPQCSQWQLFLKNYLHTKFKIRLKDETK